MSAGQGQLQSFVQGDAAFRLAHRSLRRRPATPFNAALTQTFVETLENRSLLSAWPRAPFAEPDLIATLYANQNGDAVVEPRRVNKTTKTDLYAIQFDDPGTLWFATSGSLRTSVAFYDHNGKPTATNVGQGTYGRGRLRNLAISGEKQTLYLGVQAQDVASHDKYGLTVRGPSASYVERIPISLKNHAGASGSDISGDNDCDFYRVKTTLAGDWTISIIPDRNSDRNQPGLDATLCVFDQSGTPVGGAFTRPLNKGTAGATETWIGTNLPANTNYYVRVDGYRDSTGGYGISAVWNPLPRITIAATDPLASALRSDSGRFTVTRSATDDLSSPLLVRYRIAGTATRGVDYATIGPSLTIPANQTSASLIITPIYGSLDYADKTVILHLRTSNDYVILRQTATVTISAQ